MIYLLGQPAWPQFKTQALSEALSDAVGQPVAITASELIVIDAEGPPPPTLTSILGAQVFDLKASDPTVSALIAPRPGTQTPWASRAQDIVQRCGLSAFSQLERFIYLEVTGARLPSLDPRARGLCFDRMTQVWIAVDEDLSPWFLQGGQRAPAVTHIELGSDPHRALMAENQAMGLALSDDEVDYLVQLYHTMGRGPTDAELMMFAQANSEHCRHKIFNASWTIDGQALEGSLFGLIRATHQHTPDHTVVAYDDNAAVMAGGPSQVLVTSLDDPAYRLDMDSDYHVQIKVETHNHPTAISPDPGAATGSGGEIRDESATGRGARPVAALVGFSVSELQIPNDLSVWEHGLTPPDRLASALEIMIEGPIGAARYNNEFGRPALLGYFRSFGAKVGAQFWGYHKPIMLAGGSGLIRADQTHKLELAPGDHIVVLGGPAMLIGLGGGAASSMGSGQSDEHLDYASVQRGNPEMQRRAQEVIDRCWAMGSANPIKAIHDVGAGGLSNAIPELLSDGGVGGRLSLAAIPNADHSLSPLAIWCNEAQERYVMGIAGDALEAFYALCEREQCPVASLGLATEDQRLVVIDDRDGQSGEAVIDMALDQLLGNPPSMHRQVTCQTIPAENRGLSHADLASTVEAVLAHPTVASKSFLITIGDRSVGGLSVRDQLVGPYQVPVADCAITLRDYFGDAGTAMAMGERTPLAIWDASAASRMAIGEVLTNLASVAIEQMSRIKLSANWMAAAGQPGQDAQLRRAVEAASSTAQALGLSIPVGKDSLSMHTQWNNPDDPAQRLSVTSPVSLIVSGFAQISDVNHHVTPMVKPEGSSLILIDFSQGNGPRLGGSILSQVLSREDHHGLGLVPDLDDPEALMKALQLCWAWVADGRLLACHDRSDGGVLTTVFEMALAGHCGVKLNLPGDLDPTQALAWLFNEELGLVVQVNKEAESDWLAALAAVGLGESSTVIAEVFFDGPASHLFEIQQNETTQYSQSMASLSQRWSSSSHEIQSLRDNPRCAQQAFDQLGDWSKPGLWAELSFDPPPRPSLPQPSGDAPKVAILREQGVNGQREMAMSFMAAGFEAVDVTMSDLIAGRQNLEHFTGLVACGGFSYGDVLGAGLGWARSILFNSMLKAQFKAFFEDKAHFALGVCNGCQMLSALRSIIPGTDHWPDFRHNVSEQFEARLSLVRIDESPSLFFKGMAGSVLPVATAHGEGRAVFEGADPSRAHVGLRYVGMDGRPTECYPDNPNGSVDGITGLCNEDGRVTILMPHPERLLRYENFSWAPRAWQGHSPWAKMFDNARQWVEDQSQGN